jgi:putative ABC transport system permease protein
MRRQLQREIIQIVADSIWSHKLRSALTLLGVIIGTAVVVMVGAVLTGLSRRVAQYTERTAPNAIYFTKGDRIGPSFSRPSAEERQRKDLTYEDALAVATLPSPLAVSPQKIRGGYGPTANPPKLSARGREAINPLVLGVWENFPDIVSAPVESGRFFIASERERRVQVAVIGAGIARQLFEQTDPLDQEVRIDGRVFRVIGVLAPTAGEGVLGSDELDERIVYIPFETADKLYPEIEEVAIVVRAPQGQVDRVIDEVTAMLRARRNVPPEAPNDFGVNRAEQVFDAVNQIIAGLAAIVLPIALAALAVGGVGVMNIMLVSVKERSAEIGIRRALGARKSDVRNQFLIEAMTLTGIGGLIGVFIGFLFALALRLLISFPAEAPWWAVVAGFLASVSVGLIAGMWPALRAAGLDPVVAIRGE